MLDYADLVRDEDLFVRFLKEHCWPFTEMTDTENDPEQLAEVMAEEFGIDFVDDSIDNGNLNMTMQTNNTKNKTYPMRLLHKLI